MSVKLRNGIYHADVVVNGQRVRTTTGTGSKPEALKFERNLRHEIESGTYSVTLGGALTLRAAFDKALNEHWLGKASEHTAAINAAAVCAALGDNTPLASVDSAMLWKLKTTLKAAGNANATVNRKLSCIHTLLTLAYRSWGVIKAVPYCPQEAESEGRLRIITPAEEVFIADNGDDYAPFFLLLLDTGLRLTEGLNIGVPKATEIDYMHRALRVWRSKGGKPRSIPMTERVYDILWQRRVAARPFPFSRYQADEAWQQLKRSQGITDKDYCIHALRHTFASRLVQRGVPLYVVQKLLGHASITTTERYAHLAPENMRSAIDALENCGRDVPLRVPLPPIPSMGGGRFPSEHLEVLPASIEVGSGSLPLGDSGSSGETRGGSSPLLGTLTDQEVNTPIMPVDTDDASK